MSWGLPLALLDTLVGSSLDWGAKVGEVSSRTALHWLVMEGSGKMSLHAVLLDQ